MITTNELVLARNRLDLIQVARIMPVQQLRQSLQDTDMLFIYIVNHKITCMRTEGGQKCT